jgi:hypothetical protein
MSGQAENQLIDFKENLKVSQVSAINNTKPSCATPTKLQLKSCRNFASFVVNVVMQLCLDHETLKRTH